MAEDLKNTGNQAIGMIYLAEKAIERLGWPIVVLILGTSSAGEAFIKLLGQLLERGAGHFWVFVMLIVVAVLGMAMSRRQSTALRDQAKLNRKLVGDLEARDEQLRSMRQQLVAPRGSPADNRS